MKESMLFGLAVGMVAGALLFKHCESCKDVVNKGEKALKQEIESITGQKNKKKSTSKQ